MNRHVDIELWVYFLRSGDTSATKTVSNKIGNLRVHRWMFQGLRCGARVPWYIFFGDN